MTPDYDYGLVTKRRWLWPLIDLTAVLLVTTSQAITKRLARNAARCTADHCNHHYWKAGA